MEGEREREFQVMITSQSTSGIVGNEALRGKPGAVASSVMSQCQDEQAQSKIHLTGSTAVWLLPSQRVSPRFLLRRRQSERRQLLTDLIHRRLGEEDVYFPCLTTSRHRFTFTSCFSLFLPHTHTRAHSRTIWVMTRYGRSPFIYHSAC